MPLKLLVVDATCNRNKWEYQCSDTVYAALRNAHVPLVNGLCRPTKLEEYIDAFQKNDSASAVLLFAHGAKADDPKKADRVQMTDLSDSWYIFDQLDLHLEDKLVVLCICESYGQDTVDTIIRGHTFAMTLVAPDQSITRVEAEGFFPVFFSSLTPDCRYNIDLQLVRDAMERHNHLAGNKMRIRAVS